MFWFTSSMFVFQIIVAFQMFTDKIANEHHIASLFNDFSRDWISFLVHERFAMSFKHVCSTKPNKNGPYILQLRHNGCLS